MKRTRLNYTTPRPTSFHPTMSNLKIVALISGGKDSFFSLLHCLANGHDVVALANLHPAEASSTEDTDSFMYQTIGHSVVPLYQEALGIPLYRAAITGGAVDTARVYQHQSSDKDQQGQQGQQ